MFLTSSSWWIAYRGTLGLLLVIGKNYLVMTRLSFPPPAEDCNQSARQQDWFSNWAGICIFSQSHRRFPYCIFPTHSYLYSFALTFKALSKLWGWGGRLDSHSLHAHIQLGHWLLQGRITPSYRAKERKCWALFLYLRENLGSIWFRCEWNWPPWPYPPPLPRTQLAQPNTDGGRGQAFSISESSISSTACQKGIAGFCVGLCDEMCSWFNLLRGRIWNLEQLSRIQCPQGLCWQRKPALATLDAGAGALLLMTFPQWETPGNKAEIIKKSLHLF